ncbi:MAG: Asp-tRNA(Asn)/Glu-tRNA(Gln) amidotransferase subunit GatC [Candidatus Ruthia sp.]|jgi:aspartyl-tRNA(Asn)/glutamyl-tRNA(Gln) amidotransferase subunit C|nr:Asp-tRNA(Asn)/Glu-tRNA(Gln) amidotransferase subunit GatC [Candidatus Ruthturnera sp.]MBT4123148.1 Asp-tRNA(Asn)/Glu-tRNA(Gln) amidotransferase subunit GatC [Candidatus Ruthturnera sp.]MBT4669013.1 Asp-tRNA(Asn)/Glu-tRNA(Gln) amidotransferase subunit GatC [Candidatus Ruthturnera sp.]MBT6922099.1 Asp-tRNA(Asn)/Glu-tRNA(Gln) amidotransferase subunit GatC [Candidatus Ruthturnera sp.]
MSLSEEQVGQIAYLARLSLSSDELQSNTKDLNSILSLAEQLAQIDTDNITPMAHPLHMTQRLREDKVTEEDQSESFQEIAPQTGKRHYLVPTVIE